MPAPLSIDEFLDVVRKSNVVDEKRLQGALDKLRAAGQLPNEPGKLAGLLVRDGVLTQFQAEQFLQGKWRRFTLGKYKVLERLGSGGMGSVYLCEHIMMRRRVAVKVLPTSKAEDSSCLERFYREARAVAALDHPNIVRAYDIDQEDNLHFLVMEHVDGSSLQDIIKRHGPMDVLRAAHYVRQAALGLQHAHETAALVHRDVKPGNILVDRNGIVKVLDMGLARFFNDDEDVLTKKYDENVLGTADYLAPEQALDSHSVDIRADVYSLGGTFYFCLTGRTPFAEGTVAQKLIWHQTRQPKPIRGLRPEVPEGIAAIVERMMSKDVVARYQTPQEVADALAPYTQTPIPPPPEREMPQFSLAAVPRSSGDASMSSATRPSADLPPPSPPPRKGGWQVSGATATSGPAAPAVVTAPPAPPPPPTRPIVPVVAPTAAPPVARAAPTTTPMPNNGQRPAPAMELPPAAAPSRVPERAETVRPVLPPPKPVAPPVPAPVPQTDDAPEQLAQELPFEAGGLAAAAVRRKAAASRQPEQAKSKLPLMLAGAGLLVVTFAAIGLVASAVAFGWFSSSPKKEEKGTPTRRIAVTPAGLTAALRGARPGDTYVLDGDLVEHSVHVTVPDVTIEAAEGKTVVWRYPPDTALPNVKLLHIDGAANVIIRNVTFDGGGKADACVMLYARCPGTRLENLRLQKFARHGVYVTNSEGVEGRPVTLQGLTIQTAAANQSAIHFTVQQGSKTLTQNVHYAIRDCTFEGPGKKITTDKMEHVKSDTFEFPVGTFEVVPSVVQKK